MKKVWLQWAPVGTDKSTRDVNTAPWAGPETAKGWEGQEPLVELTGQLKCRAGAKPASRGGTSRATPRIQLCAWKTSAVSTTASLTWADVRFKNKTNIR